MPYTQPKLRDDFSCVLDAALSTPSSSTSSSSPFIPMASSRTFGDIVQDPRFALSSNYLSHFPSPTQQFFSEAPADAIGMHCSGVELALDGFDHELATISMDSQAGQILLDEFEFERDQSRSVTQLSNAPSTKPRSTIWDWEGHRPLIKRMYAEENKSLKEVMDIMSAIYAFNPTLKQYKTKLREWKLAKYVPSSRSRWMSMKSNQRKSQEQKDTVFRYQDRVLTEEHVRRLARDPDAHLDFSGQASTPVDVQYFTPGANDHEEEELFANQNLPQIPSFEDFTNEDPFAAAALACPDQNYSMPNAATIGLVCELKVYEVRYNTRGQQVAIAIGKEGNWYLQKDHDLDLESALVLVRFYTNEKEFDRCELLIQSPYLISALQNVITEYPGTNIQSKTIVIRDLPMCIFHYRKELQAYGSTLLDNAAIKHLGLLLRYTFNTLRRQLEQYYISMTFSDAPGLDFEDLWMAFRPGDLLYNMLDHSSRILRLICMKRSDKSPKAPWNLTVRQINYDGTKLGYQDLGWYILPYEGHMSLNQLEMFPLEHHPKRSEIRMALVERGKKFVTLCSLQYREYHGVAQAITLSQSQLVTGRFDRLPPVKAHVNGRVMVDFRGFYEANTSHSIALTEILSVGNEAPEFQLKEDEYLLCSSAVPGFSFTVKRWFMFEVDIIRNIKFNNTAFDKLILPTDRKNLILSLVNSSIRGEFSDIVAGKGKGLVILLHGPPGVGKTLTAESVAEHTERPLYNLNVSDLSTHSQSLDRKLSEAFRMAGTWNAIILLDEADVFMASRRSGDHEQNRLVSILLHELEYYQGIIFLSTNRVGVFDEAFQSRIHLTLSYDHLSRESRRNLWRAFVTRLHDEDPKWMDDAYLDMLSAIKLNGRQIRNIVSTAHSLTAFVGGDKLSIKNLEKALEEALKIAPMFLKHPLEVSPKNDTPAEEEPGSKRRRLVQTGAGIATSGEELNKKSRFDE